jgi:hypothetical protein
MRSHQVLAPILSARHLDQLEPSLAAINLQRDDAFWRSVESLMRAPGDGHDDQVRTAPVIPMRRSA